MKLDTFATHSTTSSIQEDSGEQLSDSSDKRSRILCQSVHKHFSKTPTGKIYEEDLKDIYSLMILALDLNGTQNTKLFSNKTSGYTFSIEQGLGVLENLNFNIDNKINSITISYRINNMVGLTSLTKFFDSNLLHCPVDRTRSKLKHGTLLQPTPKGVSVVKNFVSKNGIGFEKIPEILISPLNSLEILKFERNYLNDRISYSFYLIQVLFAKIFGDCPNVWSTTGEVPKFKLKLDLNLFKSTCYTKAMKLPQEFSTRVNKYYTSPLYHKYFTNPESDSHIQYFVDGTSVRVFKDKVLHIGKQTVKFDYCVSGKAIVQWLMDCTDILSRKIAIELGQIFVNVGYLVPIIHNNCKTLGFRNSSELLFYFSDSGKNKLHWFNTIKKIKILPQKVNSKAISKERNLTLKEVLNDPGLKYIFKLHLKKEYCSENIDAYDLLLLFMKKLNLLAKLLNYINMNYDQESKIYKNQVLKISKDCLALIYHIYFTYLAPQASFVLNIDYILRSKITAVLINNDKTFDMLDNYQASVSSEDIGTSPVSCSQLPDEIHHDKGYSRTSSCNHESNHESVNSEVEVEEFTNNSSVSDRFSNQVIYAPFEPNGDDNSVFSSKVILTPTKSSSQAPNLLVVTPTSPRDKEFREIYHSLICFTPIASEIMNSLLTMMEIDSFPKFLISETFEEYKFIFD